MYQNIFAERIKGNEYSVHLYDDEKGYRNFKWNKYSFVDDPLGEFKTIDGTRCRKTKLFEKGEYEVDVPITTQILVDIYQDSDEPASWQNIFYFDIEVSMKEGLPDPLKGNNPITSIAYYDQSRDLQGVFILDEDSSVEYVKSEKYELVPCKTEDELLTKFLSVWEESKMTIVTGWNTDGFDIPYLYNRMKNVLGKDFANSLSPVGKVLWMKSQERYSIAGISSLDYLPIYKNFTFTQLSSYRLDFVAEHVLGENKIQYEGTLDDLKKNDIYKFIEYNLVDVELVYKLEKKLKFIEQAIAIATTGHVAYESIYHSSILLEGSILTYMRRNGKMVANNRPERKEIDSKFDGAYVKKPIPGRYDYIYDLDLTSMYPSIIMSLNISPETKVGKITTEWNYKKFKNGELDKIVVYLYDENLSYTFNPKSFQDMLDETKYSISSNGILYRTDTKGIVPAILENWFVQRIESKNLMKKYGNEGDDEKYEYYKKKQIIQKVLLNSLYGVLGLNGWRWYDVDNALSTTSVGQEVIKFSSNMANYFYNKMLNSDKDWVTYVDTDSLFLSALPIIKHKFPDIDENDEDLMCSKISEVADSVQKFVNESYNVMAEKMFNIKTHKFEIKQENIARRGIWVTKKRYVQKIIWENGVTKNDIDVKGLDVVRSDFPHAFRKFMKGFLEDLLNGVGKDYIDKSLSDFKDTLNSKNFNEIGKPTGVRGIKKYASNMSFGKALKGTPVHVKSAIYYNQFLSLKGLDSSYMPISDGQKIVWFYLKKNPLSIDTLAIKGYEDPPEVLEFISKYIDHDKMFERLLKKKIQYFYTALGWGEFEIENKLVTSFFEF